MIYTADRLSVLTILLGLALHGIGLTLPLSYWSFPFILASSIVIFMVYHVNHNHMHQPIFKSETSNHVINGLMSIVALNPVTLFYYSHLSNHHPNYCNDQDWTGSHHAGTRMGLIRIVRYNTSVFFHFFRNGYFIRQSKLSSSRKKSLVIELFFSLLFISISLSYFPIRSFLIHIFLPSLLGLQGMIFMNFFVHDGCDPKVRAKSCRNFTSWGANFLTFNNGYHLAHHDAPATHWSLLPELHRNKYTEPSGTYYTHSSSLQHFTNHYILARSFERS